MKKQVSGLVSARTNIEEIEYTTALPPQKRDKALEEALRDLEKSPEQLLVDTHDESLDSNGSIARVLARMASMQLRIQKEVERQVRATEELNSHVTLIGLLLGGASVLLAFAQVVLAALAVCK